MHGICTLHAPIAMQRQAGLARGLKNVCKALARINRSWAVAHVSLSTTTRLCNSSVQTHWLLHQLHAHASNQASANMYTCSRPQIRLSSACESSTTACQVLEQ